MRKIILPAFLAAAIALSGCGNASTNTSAAPVESVSLLSSIYGASMNDERQFDGIVTSGQETSIKKESGRSVSQVYVQTGDTVKEGDKLFTYDAAQAQYSLDTARLELEKLKNTLTSQQNTKAQYEKYMNSASGDDLLQYKLDVQKSETDIEDTQYQITTKENEIKSLEDATKDLDVTAPFGGKIEYAGTADASGSYLTSSDDETDTDTATNTDASDGDSSGAFIRIVDTDTYRVKGSLTAAEVSLLGVGVPVTIHSRTDTSRTWQGSVSDVSNGSGSSDASSDASDTGDTGDGDTSGSSGSYTFYVTLDSLDGLLIDQHVYVTVDQEDGSSESGIILPSSYINDPDDSAWVWRENGGKLEKTSVTVEVPSNASGDVYEVTEGLSEDDHVAAASDSYSEGMACTEDDGTYFQSYVNTLTDKTQGSSDSTDETDDTGDGDTTDGDEDVTYDEGDVTVDEGGDVGIEG